MLKLYFHRSCFPEMLKLRTLNRRSQASAQPEIFQGKEGFMELEQFDKHVKNTKKDSAGKNVGVFFLDTLKTTF